MDSSSQNPIIYEKVSDIGDRYAKLFRVVVQQTVALDEGGAISLWVGLSSSRRGQIVHGGIGMHWTKISTHVRT